MPNTHSTLRGLFSDIADAIREKDGSSGTIVADTFPDAIRAIPTGGGGEAAKSKDVNFIDYDGTIVYSYTAAEFAQLTDMPSNPSHDGLTAQGWNWTLADAQTYVASYGKLFIGQMYITDDGKTRIYIHLEEGRLSPLLGVCPNGTVTVDWGDGSETTTLTGTSVSSVKWTSNHTYPSGGDYVITLTASNQMGFTGSLNGYSYLLRYSSTTDNTLLHSIYRNSIRKVEIGQGVPSIGAYAFRDCYYMETVTIPDSVTTIGTYAFSRCGTKCITLPTAITTINTYFADAGKARIISFNHGISTINTAAFQNCPLYAVNLPTVRTISGSAFRYTSLSSITIPSTVTSIASGAFYGNYYLGYIKFTRTTPPTVANSDAWTSVPKSCIIYVPSSALSAYTSATNYPSSSTYTYVGY